MRPLHLEIHGCNSPERYDRLRECLGAAYFSLYRQGTIEGLLLDCRDREEAHLLSLRINLMEGFRAKIREDQIGPV